MLPRDVGLDGALRRRDRVVRDRTPMPAGFMQGPDGDSPEVRRALAVEILFAEGLAGDGVGSVAAALSASVGGVDHALRALVGPHRFQTLLTGAAMTAATSHLSFSRSLPRRGDLHDESHLTSLLEGSPCPGEAAVVLLAELLASVSRLLGWRETVTLLGERWGGVARFADGAAQASPSYADGGRWAPTHARAG